MNDITTIFHEQQEPNMSPQGVTKVLDWLWLGGEDDVDQILESVDVWIDFRHFNRWNRIIYLPGHVTYIRMPFMDGDKDRVKDVLSAAKSMIDSLNESKNVLISCHAGFSRSALLATWILSERMNGFDEAWLELKNRRPYVEFHENFDDFVHKLRNAKKEQMKMKRGDILIYIGNEGEQIGVVKDVGLDGYVRVGSGHFSVTVAPHSFIETIPATERSARMANYLNR